MDSIAITQSIIIPTQALPQHASNGAATIPQVPSSQPNISIGGSAQGGFDIQAAEQKRHAAVQQAAQDIANVFIVGDKTFTIFKDSTGQYITRFTSLRDGKVTYIPEPTLFKMSGGSGGGAPAMLEIEA